MVFSDDGWFRQFFDGHGWVFKHIYWLIFIDISNIDFNDFNAYGWFKHTFFHGSWIFFWRCGGKPHETSYSICGIIPLDRIYLLVGSWVNSSQWYSMINHFRSILEVYWILIALRFKVEYIESWWSSYLVKVPSGYDIHSSPWKDPPMLLRTVNHLFRSGPWLFSMANCECHNQMVSNVW